MTEQNGDTETKPKEICEQCGKDNGPTKSSLIGGGCRLCARCIEIHSNALANLGR